MSRRVRQRPLLSVAVVGTDERTRYLFVSPRDVLGIPAIRRLLTRERRVLAACLRNIEATCRVLARIERVARQGRKAARS